MTIKKYGKPAQAVITNKQSFFKKNQYHLDDVLAVNEILKRQPKRNGCKLCNNSKGKRILVHEIEYLWCEVCGHFTGEFQDTEEYINSLYIDSGGSNYSENYKNDYDLRVKDIYLPKANFLHEFMNKNGFKKYSLIDLGCGAGHFVCALNHIGIDAFGKDVSQELTSQGNKAIGKESLMKMEMNDIYDEIKNSSYDVISLVGVLEHLDDPLKALSHFYESSSKYLYLQVPLFSLSVLLEAANPDVFPRQLNKGHTHLFTKESLYWLFKKFKLSPEAEWWFGTDMVDLFRHLYVKINSKHALDDAYFNDLIIRHIDNLQKVLDESERTSGVNMIVGKA